jgi:hypothetical protein
MPDPDPTAITAESLRAREEWTRGFPDADLVWEEAADEGKGIGFDGLDPSAMVRAMYRTRAPGGDVLQWYRDSLESLGWVRREPRRDGWWEWRLPAQPGFRFDVMDHGVVVEHPGWPKPEAIVGMSMFEVLFRASSRPGVVPGESKTFLA